MELLQTSTQPYPYLPGKEGLQEVLLRTARTGDRQARNDLIRRCILVLKTGCQVTGRYLHLIGALHQGGHSQTPDRPSPAPQSPWGRVDEESRERHKEILRYSQRLVEFGIRFADLEKESPQHKDARARVITCARVVATHPALHEHVLQRKELPLKPLEQQRRYIIALSLILIGHGTLPEHPR